MILIEIVFQMEKLMETVFHQPAVTNSA